MIHTLLSVLLCTNFLVGRLASADGSTMISYAADSYALYGALHYSPAADHPAGSMREVRDWDTGRPLGAIPEVAHTYTVVGNTNEHQLTIGETTWGGREELWDTVGIDYGSLIYIALERCRTAREAIDCMINLVETYGYASEGETFSIGDPNEIWIMDMIGKGPGQKGANYVATRIPDDCICAHANQARTTTIDFRSRDVRYNKDIVKFAQAKGYYTGKRKEDFNYQEAFCPFDFSGLYVCEARVWSFFRRFASDFDRYLPYASGQAFLQTGGKDCGERMPLYFVPDHKVSLREVKEAMRDEYQGTPLSICDRVAAGPYHSKLRHGSLRFMVDSVTYWYERPTATQQTAWSFVSQMRGDNPAGGIFWFGVDDAACSCYLPFYSRISEVPEAFREGNGDLYTYSPTSAWWTFNLVANWAYTRYDDMKPEIRALQSAFDDQFESQVPAIDARIASLPQDEQVTAMTEEAAARTNLVMRAWNDLYVYLRVKYIDGQIRREENGQFKRNPYGEPEGPNRPAYPETFLRTILNETAHE